MLIVTTRRRHVPAQWFVHATHQAGLPPQTSNASHKRSHHGLGIVETVQICHIPIRFDDNTERRRSVLAPAGGTSQNCKIATRSADHLSLAPDSRLPELKRTAPGPRRGPSSRSASHSWKPRCAQRLRACRSSLKGRGRVNPGGRPHGEPGPQHFELVRATVPPLTDGQILVRNTWMSVDPYMRGRMDDTPSYLPPFQAGVTLEGSAVGEVVDSGVGRYAVQLATLAGAPVIPSVGAPGRAEGLVADEVVVGTDGLAGLSEPVHGVLDNVGGQHLALAFQRLDDDGVVQAIGKASGQPTRIDFELARTRSARGRLENFNLRTPVGPDLAYLVGLVAQGRLDPQIGWRGPWDRAPEAAEALLSRRVRGKAVLDLPPHRAS
jgi:NADPH-dependent curcumin reductase CurA